MTSEEEARMRELCALIAAEKDCDVFTQLVDELNDLLEVKRGRIQRQDSQTPN